MLIRFLLPLLFILGMGGPSFASYDNTANCKRAWILLMDLNIDPAKKILSEEIKANPTNYYLYYLDQTCDAYKLFINGSDQEYEKFMQNFQRKRKIMDGKDESSPYYNICKAEMDLQVAILSVMHNAQMSGVKKGVAAYTTLHDNMKKFPQFKQNQKLDGFFNVAVSNLPPFVKWALSIMAVKVDINKGFQLLFDYYQSQKTTPGMNAEAALCVIVSSKMNKSPESLYSFVNSLDSTVSNTFLINYFKANIAYWSSKNDEALSILKQQPPDGNPTAELIYNYMMGKVLLRKLDPSAKIYFSKYLSKLEKKEYLKEINYYLGLVHLLEGDVNGYRAYCKIVKTQGMDLNERDRDVLYDANLDYIPDINLVKAKLSLDGGYRTSYQKYLSAYETKHEKIPAYDLEYHLLKGRFAAQNSNDNLALAEFRKVIELGGDLDYSFASEAAARIGDIYREQGQKKSATEYYQKAEKLYKKRYYEYIIDKATKGLYYLDHPK